MRRAPITPLAALLLAGALLAGCGKSSPTGSAGQASSTTARAPAGGSSGAQSSGGRSSARPSRSAALAFARAVNLTAADLPGFSAGARAESKPPGERRLERKLASCSGLSGGASKALVEQSSPLFSVKRQILDLSVSSQVSVDQSAAEAARSLNALHSAKVRSCFSSYLTELLRGEHVNGARPGGVTIQSGTPPAPGTSGSFGWRVIATFIVHAIKLPIYLDFLGFIDGPSEVTLTSTGLLEPFPAETQQHLFALLLARAQEHTL